MIPSHTQQHFENLSQAFESVVDTVQESVESGLGALHVLINAANPDDFDVVNDAVIVVLDTAAMAGDIATDLMAEVFGAWKETFADSFAALADMIRRLYRQFSDFAPFFRAALRAVAATIADFAKTFRDLARFVLDQPDKIRTALERVLIPLFMAGASVFEADAAAAAIWELLKDTGSVLSQRVNALALGLSQSALSTWSTLAVESAAFTLRLGTWVAAGILDALRQAGEFAALFDDTPTGNPALDAALGPVSAFFGEISAAYIEDVETLVEAVAARLLEGAENDAELEWALLQVARFTPVGVFLLTLATSIKLVTSPAVYHNIREFNARLLVAASSSQTSI